jgi:hypothetical protein
MTVQLHSGKETVRQILSDDDLGMKKISVKKVPRLLT